MGPAKSNSASGGQSGGQGRPRVTDAQKAIVRAIHQWGLGPGDRLPTQQVLRGELGYSNNTLTPALQGLEGAGMLERKRRWGTVIVNLEAVSRGLFTVGVCIPRLEEPRIGPVYGVLLGFLQEQFSRWGCQTRIYPHMKRDQFGYEREDPIHNFRGLAEDVEGGRLDGIITTYGIEAQEAWRLTRSGFVVTQLTQEPGAPLSASLDLTGLVSQSVQVVRDAGCRRPMCLLHAAADAQGRDAVAAEAFRDAFDGAMTDRPSNKGLLGGQELGERLLAMAPAKRPDGLVLMDDHLTMGLTATLAPHPDYHPLIVTQANREAPIAFALPVVRVMVNQAAIARQGARMTVEALRDPAAVPQHTSIPVSVPEPEPRAIPSELVMTSAGPAKVSQT